MKLLWQNTTKHPLAAYKPIAQTYVDDVATEFALPHTEVAIIIVSKRRIQKMNKDYRHIPEPTDVLTFVGDDVYLGDIVICYDVAAQKAKAHQQTTEDYMRFCIVHGLLHAAGFDHQTKASYQSMMEIQERLIQRRMP
jgi:probable rRNA maturation factor